MRFLAAFLATSSFLSFLPLPLKGATISVCDEASLRTALAAGGDISFACSGTITVSTTVVVNVTATLDATGQDVTISGGGAVRVFQVSPGVTFGLRNLKIVHGFTRGTNGVVEGPGGSGDGAGIYNVSGVVFATDCRFSNHRSFGGTGGIGIGTRAGSGGSARGAALFGEAGQLFLTNCVFSSNLVSGGVGGAHVFSQSQMGLGGAGGGGAVGVLGGEAWLLGCVFADNRATATTNGAPAGQPGGAGLGGAVYARQAVIHAKDTLFQSNISEGGEGVFSSATGSGVQPGTGGFGQGGAIYSGDATLMVTNCIFSSNRSLGGNGGSGNVIGLGGDAAGGMLYSSNGSVTIRLSTIKGNQAVSGLTRRFGVPAYGSGRASGGAVYNHGSTLDITESRLLDNVARAPLANNAFGGAIYQATGTSQVNRSILATNLAVGGSGAPSANPLMNQSGGIAEGGALHVAQGRASLVSSALVGNGAFGGHQPGFGHAGSAHGGGIFNRALLTATNLTAAQNEGKGGDTASASFGFNAGSAYGGGIFNAGGTSFLSHATVASNRARPGIGTNAADVGGGIFSTNGSASLYASILAYNVPSNCFGGAFTDTGFNISSDSSCSFSGTSQHSIDPRLASVNDFGGHTLTMPLLAGSPAIDASTGPDCPSVDQRNRARPFGASCDIGAFESSPPYVIQGRVTGHPLPSGVEVVAGTQSTFTESSGVYRLKGLSSGTYNVVPSPVTHLIVPAGRLVSVGPDAVDLDFRAFRWNSVNVEGTMGQTVRLVYAGTNGDVVRIQGSDNLITWSDHSTNTVGGEGLFETSVENNGSVAGRYFRASKP